MASADRRYSSRRWRQLRADALHRDRYTCTHPGCTSDLRQHRNGFVDHIHEVKDGGDFWDIGNLQSLCRDHHGAKTYAAAAERKNKDAPTSPNA